MHAPSPRSVPTPPEARADRRRSLLGRAHWLGGALCLATCLAACADKRNYHELYREQLDASLQLHRDGRQQEAVPRLHGLLLETAERGKGDFRTQRFYAVWLLSQAHAVAFLGEAFVPVPFPGGVSTAAQRATGNLAHLVAAVLYSTYGLEWAAGARGAPRRSGDTAHLPADLDELPLEAAADGLAFLQLAAHSRLGFQERVNAVLQGRPEWLDQTRLDAAMEAARVPDGIRAWVHYGAFRHLARPERDRDHPVAFRFAVRSLELADAAGEGFDRTLREQVENWYLNDSAYRFLCPIGNVPPRRGSLVSPSDPTVHLRDFVAVPRRD